MQESITFVRNTASLLKSLINESLQLKHRIRFLFNYNLANLRSVEVLSNDFSIIEISLFFFLTYFSTTFRGFTKESLKTKIPWDTPIVECKNMFHLKSCVSNCWSICSTHVNKILIFQQFFAESCFSEGFHAYSLKRVKIIFNFHCQENIQCCNCRRYWRVLRNDSCCSWDR